MERALPQQLWVNIMERQNCTFYIEIQLPHNPLQSNPQACRPKRADKHEVLQLHVNWLHKRRFWVNPYTSSRIDSSIPKWMSLHCLQRHHQSNLSSMGWSTKATQFHWMTSTDSHSKGAYYSSWTITSSTRHQDQHDLSTWPTTGSR